MVSFVYSNRLGGGTSAHSFFLVTLLHVHAFNEGEGRSSSPSLFLSKIGQFGAAPNQPRVISPPPVSIDRFYPPRYSD